MAVFGSIAARTASPEISPLSMYDVFVIPSQREGLGYSALEAMALGKPVIASSVGGLMGVVRDEETGLLFQPDNPRKLAEKIVYLFDNPDEIARMGRRGREVIENEFSIENMVQGMLGVYRGLSEGDISRGNT